VPRCLGGRGGSRCSWCGGGGIVLGGTGTTSINLGTLRHPLLPLLGSRMQVVVFTRGTSPCWFVSMILALADAEWGCAR
jgi:hypothetical protein